MNLKNKKSIISVVDLNVAFRDAKNKKKIINIIRNISFKIKEGEIVGFIGESGSGKTVTAKSLFGMNINSISTATKLQISGIDATYKIKDKQYVIYKNSQWRKIRGKKITYIPQNPMTSLNPTMKIKNQIIEAIKVSNPNLSKKEALKQSIEILEKFGIKNVAQRINAYPHAFSGGMRQRVVIAMSVISKPDVIIADEPTTALDPTIQSSILNLFKVIVKEYNISIIIVSHDISVISTLCDFVNVFYAGRIIEQGFKYEVFTNPQHPYTWALLSSMPEANTQNKKLFTLDGSPPNFDNLPFGDPFSVRNPYAMQIDFKKEPPLFKVGESKTHKAATWLLHPNSPKVQKPDQVIQISKQILKDKYANKK